MGNIKAIKVSNLFNIDESEMRDYKLHLACRSGHHPLDLYIQDQSNWVDWNQWRRNYDDFNRKYIFGLMDFYHEKNKWLFGGIFKVPRFKYEAQRG